MPFILINYRKLSGHNLSLNCKEIFRQIVDTFKSSINSKWDVFAHRGPYQSEQDTTNTLWKCFYNLFGNFCSFIVIIIIIIIIVKKKGRVWHLPDSTSVDITRAKRIWWNDESSLYSIISPGSLGSSNVYRCWVRKVSQSSLLFNIYYHFTFPGFPFILILLLSALVVSG